MLLSTELMDLLKDCYWEASLPEDLPNLSREVKSATIFSLRFPNFMAFRILLVGFVLIGIRGGIMGDVYSLFYGITSFVNVEHYPVVAPSSFT